MLIILLTDTNTVDNCTVVPWANIKVSLSLTRQTASQLWTLETSSSTTKQILLEVKLWESLITLNTICHLYLTTAGLLAGYMCLKDEWRSGLCTKWLSTLIEMTQVILSSNKTVFNIRWVNLPSWLICPLSAKQRRLSVLSVKLNLVTKLIVTYLQ